MSEVRTRPITSIILLSLLIVMGALPAQAQTAIKTTLTSENHTVSLNQTNNGIVHVTLRTQEGLERFVFRPQGHSSSHNAETHYAGFARPRNFQRDKLPASLTVTDKRAWIFFTSRRTGRPVAATISLSAIDSRILAKHIAVSRVPKRKVACGSHVEDEHHEPSTVPAAHSRRTNVSAASPLSQQAPLSAQGLRASSPVRVLEVATDADYDFFQIHGDQTNSYIRAVMNAVDVIYTSSLGIRIKVTTQRVSKTDTGARGTIQAVNLLEQFRNSPYASSSPADVRHLFTGRSIEGMTIGIAYVGTVCTAGGTWSVGLSNSVRPGLQPFLAAHEIAHNLSATHDQDYHSIMNPAITEDNNRFSARSASTIHDFVATTGSCMGTEELSGARVTLDSSDPTRFSATVAFETSSARSCSVVLYGSTDGRRFVTLVSDSYLAHAGEGPAVVTFASEAPRLAGAGTFYFRAKVSCGTSRTVSQASKLRYGFATSGTSSQRGASRWLAALKRNLNPR